MFAQNYKIYLTVLCGSYTKLSKSDTSVHDKVKVYPVEYILFNEAAL